MFPSIQPHYLSLMPSRIQFYSSDSYIWKGRRRNRSSSRKTILRAKTIHQTIRKASDSKAGQITRHGINQLMVMYPRHARIWGLRQGTIHVEPERRAHSDHFLRNPMFHIHDGEAIQLLEGETAACQVRHLRGKLDQEVVKVRWVNPNGKVVRSTINQRHSFKENWFVKNCLKNRQGSRRVVIIFVLPFQS